MSTGLRAFGDLRLSYDLRAPTNMVLHADGTDGNSYVEFDNGSAITDFWIEIGVGWTQATLDFWDIDGDASDAIKPRTAAMTDAVPAGVIGTGSGIFYNPSDSDVPVTASVYHVYKYHRNGSTINTNVDGTPVRVDAPTGAAAVRYFRFGQNGVAADPNNQTYISYVKIGTTEGGTDIFTDDFEDGTLDAWTSTSDAVSVIDNPF